MKKLDCCEISFYFFNLVSSSKINKRSSVGLKVQGMNKRSRKVWRMTVFFLFFGAFSVIAIFSTRWRYLSGQRLKETHQVLLGMVNFSLLDFIDDLNIRCFLYRFFFSVSLLFLLYTSSAHGIRLSFFLWTV